MGLNVQLLTILIAFLFGFFYCVLFKYYKKYIRSFRFYVITDFLYNFIFFAIYCFVFYKLNNLYLNYYMFIFFFIGFLIAYLTVNIF